MKKWWQFWKKENADLEVERKSGAQLIQKTDESPSLHLAAKEGNLDLITQMLNTRILVDSIGPNGRTPLHFAALNGHVEVARYLLEWGANPNALTSDGENPLHMALSTAWALKFNPKMIELLVKVGCDVNALDGHDELTPLYMCDLLRENGVIAAEILLKNGALVNKPTPSGWTALHISVYDSNINLAKTLIRYGADVFAKTKDGKTPYQLALHGCVNGFLDRVSWRMDYDKMEVRQEIFKLICEPSILKDINLYSPHDREVNSLFLELIRKSVANGIIFQNGEKDARIIEIGELLYKRGDKNLMLSVYEMVKSTLGSFIGHRLEVAWSGIGTWLA